MASNQAASDKTKINGGIVKSQRCLISEVIHKLAASIANLVHGVIKEGKCGEKVLEEIEKENSFNHHEDPRIAMGVEKLKQGFREVIVYSDHIKVACKSLTRYSSNQKHVQTIKDDLQSGKLQKLKRFLEDVGYRLATFSQRLDGYKEMLDKLQNQLQTESLTTKCESASMQIIENKKQDVHYASLFPVVLAGLGATDSSVQALAVLTSAPTARKPKGIFTGTTMIGHVFSIANSLNQKELEILDRAEHFLLSLQKEVNKIKTEVREVKLCVNSATECVESSVIRSSWGGIKRQKCPLIGPSSGTTDGKLESVCDIEEKLDELQTEMEKAFKILDSKE